MFRALLVSILLAVGLHAEDLYVTPAGGGTTNGSSWTNAFAGFGDVAWGGGAGQVGPGDTLWVAGGTYGARLQIGADGTSGSRITVKRVLSSDTGTPGVGADAAGYSAGFDAQVVIPVTGSTTGIYFNSGIGDYVTVDGRTRTGSTDGANPSLGFFGTYGWKVTYEDTGNGVELDGSVYTGVRFRYIECVGPGLINQSGETCGFQMTNSGTQTDIWMQYCSAHNGGDTTVHLTTSTGFLMEYCAIYYAGANNPASWHPNIFIFNAMSAATIRFNIFADIRVEGVFHESGTSDDVKFYGNLLYVGANGQTGGRGIENNGTMTNWLIYNNTFVDFTQAPINLGAGAASSNLVKNNLFINSGGNTFGSAVVDYNGSSGTAGGTNGTNNITAPFVAPLTYDYHIVDTISATKPRNKGTDLGASYNVDMDGVSRTGLWSLGTFEYAASGVPTLVSATIPTGGTTISLVFSESCTTGAGGAAGVTINPSSGASTATYSSGSGSTTYVYSLSRTIQIGEVVTVSYVQPGNGIEATSGGGDVATFSNAAVTNSSTYTTVTAGNSPSRNAIPMGFRR